MKQLTALGVRRQFYHRTSRRMSTLGSAGEDFGGGSPDGISGCCYGGMQFMYRSSNRTYSLGPNIRTRLFLGHNPPGQSVGNTLSS